MNTGVGTSGDDEHRLAGNHKHPVRAIGQRLQAARLRQGWTYREMEAKTGISKSTLQYMVQRRQRAPDYYELRAIVTKLGEQWDDEWERLWRVAAEADPSEAKKTGAPLDGAEFVNGAEFENSGDHIVPAIPTAPDALHPPTAQFAHPRRHRITLAVGVLVVVLLSIGSIILVQLLSATESTVQFRAYLSKDSQEKLVIMGRDGDPKLIKYEYVPGPVLGYGYLPAAEHPGTHVVYDNFCRDAFESCGNRVRNHYYTTSPVQVNRLGWRTPKPTARFFDFVVDRTCAPDYTAIFRFSTSRDGFTLHSVGSRNPGNWEYAEPLGCLANTPS